MLRVLFVELSKQYDNDDWHWQRSSAAAPAPPPTAKLQFLIVKHGRTNPNARLRPAAAAADIPQIWR